jgi:CRP/FNR family cyclic AMP-dependent transcriptional regulator
MNAVLTNTRKSEDALAYLPCSTIQQFASGETIYQQKEASEALYLIIEGRVKVSRMADSSRTVLVDIYRQDQFFGESALISSTRLESAIALEPVRLMSWTIDQINQLTMDRPKLGLALLQLIVKRTQDSERRIESLAFDGIQRRLARTLLRFSEQLGQETRDGKVIMNSLTHQLLAEYVGTSREIITQFMNEFRSKGYLAYSRRTTVVNTAGLAEGVCAIRPVHRTPTASLPAPVSFTPTPYQHATI